MFFRKTERKKSHPLLVLAVGTLAVIGAVGIVGKGKCWMKEKMDKMKKMFVKDSSDCQTECE